MANFQVRDGYGSVITIQSSTFSSAERQIVGASIIGTFPVTISGNPSISGTVNIAGTPSISGQVGASIIGTVPIVQSGTLIASTIGAIAPTATVTSVVTAASTATLLASNSGRRGATISNYSGTSVLVRLGNMSGVTDHTVVMQNTDYYEVPFNYSGVIQHFSSSVAGFIRITEIT